VSAGPTDETTPETALALGRPRRPLAERQSLASLKGRLFGTPASPVKLDRYVLLDRIGAGGMGVIYAAYDPELDRRVAIKLLLAREGQGDDDARARLLREAQALARVAHPNIVPVYDVGTYDADQLGLHEDSERSVGPRGVYVVMELVVGGTLKDWLAKGTRSWREVLDVFLQAGRGLASAHEQGLVHRDFKPSNVVVGEDGRARVLDFGLARAVNEQDVEVEPPDESPESGGGLLDSPLTQSGTVMGTPRYMAPEQHAGASAEPSADQFSFCAALYEGLYGIRAFAGDDSDSIAASKRTGRVRKPTTSDVPAWIFRVCMRGLDPEPTKRFSGMAVLLDQLETGLRSRTRAVWSGVGLAGLILGAAAVFGLTGVDSGHSCVPGTQRVASVWNEQAKAGVANSFESSRLPYAAASFEAVVRTTDDYAQAWAAMYDDACQATHVRHEQSAQLLDLKMDCLGERLAELEALREVLASADDETLEHAVQAASELSPLSPCADARGLRREEGLPNERASENDKALRTSLADARVRLNAARYEEALSVVEELIAQGPWSGGPSAQIGLVHGRAERALGHSSRAESILFEALLAARSAQRPGLEFDLLLDLASVVAGARVDLDEAARWLAFADALVQSRELDVARQARLAQAWGSHEVRKGDPAAALPRFAEAMTLAEEAHGPASPAIAPYAFALAEAYRDRGDWERAEESLNRVLELRKSTVGDEHPSVAEAYEGLGTLFIRRGEWKLALGAHERCLAIRERAFDSNHPSIAGSLNNVASAKAAMGDQRGAADALTRALEIARKHYGDESPRVAPFHSNLGTMLADMGELASAKVHVERALDIVVRAFGEAHPHVAYARQNCAHVYALEGESDRAIESYRLALQAWERVEGPDHPMVLGVLNSITDLYIDTERPREALPDAERAVELLDRQEVAPVDAATARFSLARITWDLAEDPDRARRLAAEARDGFANSEGGADQLKYVEEWLAERSER
jgi:tetratricopeptide (TPR) repeat protein